MKFTFDTNCLIDLDETRPSAKHIHDLIRAHRAGKCEVAFVAVSASERQPGDRYLETFAEFEARLRKLKIEDIPTILGMAYWDISYWDHAVLADEKSGFTVSCSQRPPLNIQISRPPTKPPLEISKPIRHGGTNGVTDK